MKRYFIKWIRDACKSAYQKGNACEICDSTENLDFHHFSSLSELVHRWERNNKLNVNTDELALQYRDKFIEEHYDEIYNDTVTLCHEHHLKLHSIYGKNPKLVTAKKQMRWVEIQREKYGMV